MLKTRFCRSALLAACLGMAMGLTFQSVEAAPVLDIRNGNNSGPPADPSASEGQWFNDGTARPHEFYDNQTGNGGGSASTGAITGKIINLSYDESGLVSGFTIRSSITNDLSGSGVWAAGSNTHSDLNQTPVSASTLYLARMTIEFADDGTRGNFPSGGSPYIGPESNIYAIDYDALAWYSYTSTGNFWVPTYDFGNIHPGQTVTRDLQFGLYTHVDQATIQNLINANDIYMNRTTDLKIGNYFDSTAIDDGSAYPASAMLSGNVSVFAVPEPTSVSLLMIGIAGLVSTARYRKTES